MIPKNRNINKWIFRRNCPKKHLLWYWSENMTMSSNYPLHSECHVPMRVKISFSTAAEHFLKTFLTCFIPYPSSSLKNIWLSKLHYTFSDCFLFRAFFIILWHTLSPLYAILINLYCYERLKYFFTTLPISWNWL